MPDVEVSLAGNDVEVYWLSIFNEGGYHFRGDAHQDFDGVLASGQYTLLYHVIGPSQSDFSILFDGVTQPESPYPRRIPNKGFTAATITMRV